MRDDVERAWTRRALLARGAGVLGAAALAQLFGAGRAEAGGAHVLHLPARAKRVIYLFMSGGPSQLDLFEPKPKLAELHGTDLPPSVRNGQRITGMTSGQKRLPIAASPYAFLRGGRCGAPVSELMPHVAAIADELCFVRSVNTEAINHDPAITFMQTGHQQPGRPSLGSWLSWGIGSENSALPAFAVMISNSVARPSQALFDRLWSAGFLPAAHQGVRFRGAGEPVPYLEDPPGVDRARRARMIAALGRLNGAAVETIGDPEIAARIAQYELAFRMQASVPELTDLAAEPASTFALYGEAARRPGTFAANCLLARRLAERGVRFIQLYHRDWDHHANLAQELPEVCRVVDQPSAALVTDLRRRGLLEDTLVIWGGEFGRTVYSQGELGTGAHGRDHHGRCFTVWLAGGGVKRGFSYGATDELGYNVTENPVHIHDLHATILHCLGLDHERLTFKYQGRDFRLTDVGGRCVRAILA
jgi:hypothetical protein